MSLRIVVLLLVCLSAYAAVPPNISADPPKFW